MEKISKNMSTQEKLDYIFSALESGLGREEIASQLGYKTHKSMDMFVRRQNYSWDGRLGKYLLPDERNSGRYAKPSTSITGKVGDIVSLFSKGELDAKAIAEQMGFSSHRDLALYMKAKGYRWDDALGNYQLEVKQSELPSAAFIAEDSCDLADDVEKPMIPEELDKYQDLLSYLLEKEHVLRSLLDQGTVTVVDRSIPRYAVPGIFVTKSVHMTNQLDQLVRDYSKEKNVSQRELFEVALVEFFQKYGYKSEIDTLLQQQ